MKTITILSLIILFLFPLLISAQEQGQKPQWKGKIEYENGVKVIKNPKEPMYEEKVFFLEEELSIETKEVNQEKMFQTIVSLAVGNNGNIYILDKKAGNIKIFDKNGKFLKIIGRRGQGPGEFGVPEHCALSPNNELFINDPGRRIIHVFDSDGKFIRQIPIKVPFFEGPRFTPKGKIIAGHGILRTKEPSFQLKKFDSEMKPILTFTSIPILKPPKVHVFIYYTASDLKWDVSSQDEIIWGVMTTPEYELFVHDGDGKYIKRITKKFTPTKLSNKEYERLMTKWFGKVPSLDKWDLIIPKNYPPFQGFIVDDEGRIFVRRFVEVEKSDKHYLDVFDEEGKYITNITLDIKFRFVIFKNKKLFSIEENQEGYQVVKRYKVIWKGME